LVMRLKWKLVLVRLDIVLIMMQESAQFALNIQ
jgi:hypothetical protein